MFIHYLALYRGICIICIYIYIYIYIHIYIYTYSYVHKYILFMYYIATCTIYIYSFMYTYNMYAASFDECPGVIWQCFICIGVIWQIFTYLIYTYIRIYVYHLNITYAFFFFAKWHLYVWKKTCFRELRSLYQRASDSLSHLKYDSPSYLKFIP